jgi:hypothetical protein
MATLHHFANALTTIASKVNAHQILIEDLKKSTTEAPLAHASSSPPVLGADYIDRPEVQRMVDTLKDDVSARHNREKAMLEANINHAVDQKIAAAVAEVDQKGAISLLEDRMKKIEERIEALLSASGPITVEADATNPDAASETSVVGTSDVPPEPSPITSPTPTAATKSRASRRRAKAPAGDSPPGTLTLE